MAKKWKKYIGRAFLAVTSVSSLFAGVFILYDLYIKGLNNVEPRTMTFLAVALIFLAITMQILMNDLYKVKK
jgi:membrane-bound ClpP family serine protease